MIKSAIIFIAWICSFKAIKKLPIGFYGIMDMSRNICDSAGSNGAGRSYDGT